MSEQYPRTALFGTEERTLFCPTLGREYHLSVALPDSYLTSISYQDGSATPATAGAGGLHGTGVQPDGRGSTSRVVVM
jgi:hypothetical protein